VTTTWQPHVPAPRRSGLSWAGWVLIALSSVAAVATALAMFSTRPLPTTPTSDSSFLGFQVGAGISILFFVLWILSLNIASVGLVLAMVAAATSGSGRWWRLAALPVVAIGGTAVELWGLTTGTSSNGPSYFGATASPPLVDQLWLHTLVVCLTAVLVIAGTGVLLRPWRPARSTMTPYATGVPLVAG
jgi:NADH:ubiquinone oxidoreductase subunit 6 (subunit J)